MTGRTSLQSLFVAAVVGLILCVSPPAAAADPGPDQLTPYQSGHGWFTRDKAYHFAISAVGSAAVYAAARELGLGRWPSVAISAVVTGTAGFLRETLDGDDPESLLTRAHFSRRDMVWNGAGIAVGISLTEVFAGTRWR